MRGKTMGIQFCKPLMFFVIVVGIVSSSALDLALEWVHLDNGRPMEYVSALEGSKHRLYAAASEGIFFSENGGDTWLSTSFELEEKFITTLTVDGNTVYVGTWLHGVFRSDDGGVTWKSINEGLRFQVSDGRRLYSHVRRILIIDETLINVMHHSGTYTSTDHGETWQDVSEAWYVADSIYSMTMFDGYWWSAMSIEWMARSPDDGQTWQPLINFQEGRVNDWAVLNGQLYVAGEEGVGRWNETLQMWEYPMDGLLIDISEDSNDPPYISCFAVHGEQLFAGLDTHGVYLFEAASETWSAVGLQGLSILSLLSQGDFLYAGTEDNGIYRTELPVASLAFVQPQGKVLTTWADMKRTTPEGN